MIRISATADLHFRPKRAAEVFASLDNLERESREREVDLIAISGDLFHSAVFATGTQMYPEFIERVRRLADVAPVVMVYGTPSHDIAGCLDVFESQKAKHSITIIRPSVTCGLYLDEYGAGFVVPIDHVHGANPMLLIFGIPEPHKGWLLKGKPAMGPEATTEAMKKEMRNLLLGYAAQRKEHPDIPCLVLYHGQIRGATMDNGVRLAENAIGRDDLAMIGADYYALGDIHAPQQIGELPMYYPGSVYPRTWGETHQAGFNVVTIGPMISDYDPGLFDGPDPQYQVHEVERVDYPHPQQMKICVEAERRSDTGAIEFDTEFDKVSYAGCRVKVEITARREIAPEIDTMLLLGNLLGRGALEGSEVTLAITHTETVRAGEITKAVKLRGKAGVYAENSSQEIAESVLAKADELEKGASDAGHTDGAWIRLRKLILRGAIGIWKGHGRDEITIDLDEYDPGLIGLLWPNGGGKTTLIENMHPWPTLLTRDGKLASHFRLRDSYRDLYFTDERTGDEYRALLQINGTSKAGELDYLLYRNGEPVKSINGRKDPYVEKINELFGGLDLYLRSAFVSQKDAGLADATKGERKALLVELSGLEYLQGYADSAKARARLITDELATDAGWITATEEQLAALPELATAQTEKATEYRAGTEAVAKLEASGTVLRTEHDAMSAKVADDRALRQEREDLNTRDGKLTAEHVEMTAEREGWEAAADGREAAAARVANWEELEDERKTLEAQKAQTLEDRAAELERYTVAHEGYASERRAMEEDKRNAEAALDNLVRDQKTADTAMERLGELLDAPRHDTCPECNAVLPWAGDERIKRDERQWLLDDNQAIIWEIDKKIPDAVEVISAISKSFHKLVEPAKPEFPSSTLQDKSLARVDSRQAVLDITAARATVVKADEAVVHIEEIHKRFVLITTERDEIEGRLADLFTLIDDTLAADFDALTGRLEVARRQHTAARETLAALNAEAEAITRQIDDLRRKAEKLEERRGTVATKRIDADEWTWLQRACGPDGIQALELDALAPSIEEVANRLLQAAYGSRFSIRFETTRLDATGKKQLEDFLILIADSEHGDEQELSTLSGGEAVWIKRALYDSFGIIRARNTGLKFLTVMQDESDGALDPEHREQYARMLEAAHAESGRHHTIMITHSAEVQEMLGQRIEIAAPEAVREAVGA